jgi:hypothetical protein
MADRRTFSLAEPRYQNRRVILPTHNRGNKVPAAFWGLPNQVVEVIVTKLLTAAFLVLALILSSSPGLAAQSERPRTV